MARNSATYRALKPFVAMVGNELVSLQPEETLTNISAIGRKEIDNLLKAGIIEKVGTAKPEAGER